MSVASLLTVAWCSCKIVHSFTHLTCCRVECLILEVIPIFDNTFNGIFPQDLTTSGLESMVIMG